MPKVQDYGKDTAIDIASVLYFHADHKYVDVTYWCDERKDYLKQTLQWSLKSILTAHPEFEQTHRAYLVRRTAIEAMAQPKIVGNGWYADLYVDKWDCYPKPSGFRVPVSRRLVPHIRKIANANSATA